MIEISANDVVATRHCKIDGCPFDPVDHTGRFAGLCKAHKQSKIDEMRNDPAARARISAGRRAALAGQFDGPSTPPEASRALDEAVADVNAAVLRLERLLPRVREAIAADAAHAHLATKARRLVQEALTARDEALAAEVAFKQAAAALATALVKPE